MQTIGFIELCKDEHDKDKLCCDAISILIFHFLLFVIKKSNRWDITSYLRITIRWCYIWRLLLILYNHSNVTNVWSFGIHGTWYVNFNASSLKFIVPSFFWIVFPSLCLCSVPIPSYKQLKMITPLANYGMINSFACT